jgi:hypothetical protein
VLTDNQLLVVKGSDPAVLAPAIIARICTRGHTVLECFGPAAAQQAVLVGGAAGGGAAVLLWWLCACDFWRCWCLHALSVTLLIWCWLCFHQTD